MVASILVMRTRPMLISMLVAFARALFHRHLHAENAGQASDGAIIAYEPTRRASLSAIRLRDELRSTNADTIVLPTMASRPLRHRAGKMTARETSMIRGER